MANKKLSYEEALTRLQIITKELELNKADLEQSLKLFEEGTKLSAYCYKILEDARKKVDEITEV